MNDEERRQAFSVALRLNGGMADWIWDDELQMHIPCCSRRHRSWRCGNGPLTKPEDIASGDCGQTHSSEHRG